MYEIAAGSVRISKFVLECLVMRQHTMANVLRPPASNLLLFRLAANVCALPTLVPCLPLMPKALTDKPGLALCHSFFTARIFFIHGKPPSCSMADSKDAAANASPEGPAASSGAAKAAEAAKAAPKPQNPVFKMMGTPRVPQS